MSRKAIANANVRAHAAEYAMELEQAQETTAAVPTRKQAATATKNAARRAAEAAVREGAKVDKATKAAAKSQVEHELTSGGLICEMLVREATVAEITVALGKQFPDIKVGQNEVSAYQQIMWYKSQLKSGKRAVDMAPNGVPFVIDLKRADDPRLGTDQLHVPTLAKPKAKKTNGRAKKQASTASA